METIRKIRACYRAGDGIRKITRDFNVSRVKVREIIRSEQVEIPVYKKRAVQVYPKLGLFIVRLKELLEESVHVKPKRSAESLYDQLVTEGYTGSSSAVRRYVQQWKATSASTAPAAAYVPLSFCPGEAYQFDWSEDSILINDVVVKVKVAHFVLCYSRKKFTYAYLNETQEMVFDAHIRAFAFFGGVPCKGIYDNMKTAVSKVLLGSEREFNPAFERLCAHYRVTPVACTPASGWEKGQVERQVQIDRAQFFTPMPKVTTIAALNDRLMSQVIAYNSSHKHPSYKDKTIDEVFEKERMALSPAPIPFDGCKERDCKVSSTCLVMIDRNSYSVPCALAGKIIQCRIYADKLVCVYRGTVIAEHPRRFTLGQTYYHYPHYLPLLARKPGALRNGEPFLAMELPAELVTVRNHLEQHPNGTRDFAKLLAMIPATSLDRVQEACKIAILQQTISKDVIINILLRTQDIPCLPSESSEYAPHLQLITPPTFDCARYDFLLKGVVR